MQFQITALDVEEGEVVSDDEEEMESTSSSATVCDISFVGAVKTRAMARVLRADHAVDCKEAGCSDKCK